MYSNEENGFVGVVVAIGLLVVVVLLLAALTNGQSGDLSLREVVFFLTGK